MLSEQAKENRRKYQKSWHKNNKERVNSEARDRYYKNKELRLAKQRAYHNSKKNDEAYLQKRRESQRNRRALYKRQWISFKSTLKCSVCGESRWQCLDFHHEDKSKKEFSVSSKRCSLMKMERLLKEISKCTVLCSNCHRMVHADECN